MISRNRIDVIHDLLDLTVIGSAWATTVVSAWSLVWQLDTDFDHRLVVRTNYPTVGRCRSTAGLGDCSRRWRRQGRRPCGFRTAL
jgi:hypothetical protein